MEVLDLVVSSLSDSTLKQYKSSLKYWLSFCSDKNLDPFNPEISQVLLFLYSSFNSGAAYGTLNTLRSAISLISKNKVGDDPLVTRCLKGCFRRNPSKPKYLVTWDVNIVLDYIESLGSSNNLPINVLSEKIVTLLALITAHRAQTISNVKISNIRHSNSGVEIYRYN